MADALSRVLDFKRVRELGGLRAIAILLVLMGHFYRGPGWIGVDLFLYSPDS